MAGKLESYNGSSSVASRSGNRLLLDDSSIARRYWRDLIYREALRVVSAFRQALAQSSTRAQIVLHHCIVLCLFFF